MTEAPPDTSTRATTPLLALITQESLDADYRVVAARRVSAGAAPQGDRSRWAAAAVVGVFGVMITVAAVQTSRNADVDDAGRATLISQIREAKADVADQQARIADLRRDNLEAEATLADLTAAASTADAGLRRLQALTGYLPVHGPGVRIKVANPPDADLADQVRDEDLAKLVDGLWRAGAEAIAINGQRLTVLSPIRNSGPAIHVNTRPLTAPYTVAAIGDPRTLEADLLATTHGSEFFSIADQLGFIYTVDTVQNGQDGQEIVLPAARMRRLVSVEAGTAADNRKQEGDKP